MILMRSYVYLLLQSRQEQIDCLKRSATHIYESAPASLRIFFLVLSLFFSSGRISSNIPSAAEYNGAMFLHASSIIRMMIITYTKLKV